MANRIVLKKSSVSSKVPLAGDLEYGELALNYTDEKLYFKNAANAIKSFNVAQATLTIGTGLSGTSYNGTSAVTIAINSTVATLTGTQTLTNKTIAASNNTISGLTNSNLSGTAGISNANLANSSVTIGSTAIALGASATTIAGLTSVTSTGFTGALTGNASTATTLQTARTINGVSFNGSANITVTANTTNALTIGTGLSGTSFNGSGAVTIALASGYGDTQNPYASKTANNFLAAPNGSNGAPTFRAIVAADIPTLNQNTTGSAATLTTARTIGGVSFNGSANINLPGVNTTGNQNTTGSAATLTTTRTLWGQNFNGSADVTGALSSVTTLSMSGQLTSTVATGTAPLVVASTTRVANLNVATAGTADTLTTTRAINGVNFNGSAAITVPLNTTNRTTNETGHMVFTGTTATGNVSAYTNTAVRVNPSQGRLEANGVSAAAGLIEHANNITVTYTMKTGNNAVSAGPVTIDTGGSITIPDGSTWIIISPT